MMPISRLSAAAALVWLLAWIDATLTRQLPIWVLWGVFTAVTVGAIASTFFGKLPRRLAMSIAFVPVCHWLFFSASQLGWNAMASAAQRVGIAGMFVLGLGWLVYYVERRSRHLEMQPAFENAAPGLNPLDLDSKFYRKRNRRLDQSLGTVTTYTLAFLLAFVLVTRIPGCDIYELPLGGGKPKPIHTVRLQRVVEKKFVINPYSVVKFNPPPIEKVQLQLLDVTHHAYEVGYGEEDGAGFAGGTARGKVEFVRIQYDGGDWDQDLSNESDLNMLTEYQVRTGHRCARLPKTRRISQLTGMPAEKSPAFVYITGQGNLLTSKREQEILRELITERHGMIFADNGGSGGWHQQFFDLMRRVLPNIEPVRVPLDHPIHRLRYNIPFLPYVAPHGGKDAWGWVVEGRLAAYYHPGDIGDAWGNGHAGVRREIWEYCYQLGVNAMLYAHIEKSKWLTALAKAKEQN